MQRRGSTSRQRTRNRAAASALLVLIGMVTLRASAQSRALPAAPASADTTLITIRSTGTILAFEPDRISVKHGSVVRIRYVNESSFAHNLVIVRKDDDIDTIGAASFQAGESGFVPMEHRSKMIAYSPLAAAGSTVEFTFEAPAPGQYPFVCFVDGHFNMMVGTLRSL
jgi:plastocyanin